MWVVIRSFAFALLLLSVSAVSAHAELSTIFKDPSGVAIEGYDVVAFTKDKKALEGSQKIRYDWNSASWYFSSRENRDLFAASPKEYVPQYGGYCAYAVASTGQLIGSDPQIWTVLDNKVFLFNSVEARQNFIKRAKKLHASADKNWKTIFSAGN